jgi:hypothetical protein
LPKFLQNFLSNSPIDLCEREAPPGKTRAPLSIRGQQKACFPQWMADRRLFIGRKGTDSRTACRAKGPYGYAGAKARNDRTRDAMGEIARAADQRGIQEG